PRPAAVHVGIRAAGERRLARELERMRRVVCGVDRLQLDPGLAPLALFRRHRHNRTTVVAAAVAAISLCRPVPGLGTLMYDRGGRRHIVDLATCRDRVIGRTVTTRRPRPITSP